MVTVTMVFSLKAVADIGSACFSFFFFLVEDGKVYKHRQSQQTADNSHSFSICHKRSLLFLSRFKNIVMGGKDSVKSRILSAEGFPAKIKRNTAYIIIEERG